MTEQGLKRRLTNGEKMSGYDVQSVCLDADGIGPVQACSKIGPAAGIVWGKFYKDMRLAA